MNTQNRGSGSGPDAPRVEEASTGCAPRPAIEEIGQRIKSAREDAGLTQEALAKAIRVHTNTLGKVERGATVPDAQMLLDIAGAVNVLAAWLLVGDSKTAGPRSTASDWGDLAIIPAYDIDASAGNGIHVHEEEIVGNFAMPRSWLTRKGLNAATLVVVNARGDSMEPTIRDGDVLVVDRNVSRLAGDGIYLIERDNDLYCKRLQKRFDGGVVIMSDNTRYEPQQLTAEAAATLNVIGRVVWSGGER